MNNIPFEITLASFSLIGVMMTYIWRENNIKISKLEKHLQNCPYSSVAQDIAVIKNELKWIKKKLNN